mgnify:CR=1 FL=1
MRTYLLSPAWTWFIYIGGGLLALCFGYVTIMPFVDESMDPSSALFFVPLGLAMMAFMILGIRDAYRGRLEVYSDRFVQYTWRREKQLLHSEVKGFRQIPQYILIESNNPEKKGLKISTYYGNLDELFYFLEQEFTDLDAQQYAEEEQKILDDPSLGLDTAERAQRLEQARLASQILNYAGLAILLWLLFYPTPYVWAMWAAIILPIITLPFIFIYKGIIRFDELNSSAHPSVFVAMVTPSLALALRAFLDYDLLHYRNIWLPIGIITLAFLGIIVRGTGEFDFQKPREYFKILGISLFFAAYGFGAYVFLNCYYEDGEPYAYTAEVLDQRISDGSRYTSYYLELRSEEGPNFIEEVEVTEDLYYTLDTGDQVGVFLWPGRLGTPWRMVNALSDY